MVYIDCRVLSGIAIVAGSSASHPPRHLVYIDTACKVTAQSGRSRQVGSRGRHPE